MGLGLYYPQAMHMVVDQDDKHDGDSTTSTEASINKASRLDQGVEELC